MEEHQCFGDKGQVRILEYLFWNRHLKSRKIAALLLSMTQLLNGADVGNEASKREDREGATVWQRHSGSVCDTRNTGDPEFLWIAGVPGDQPAQIPYW